MLCIFKKFVSHNKKYALNYYLHVKKMQIRIIVDHFKEDLMYL